MGLPTKLRRVEPSIPKGTFSIAVLGEAPGQEEERQGKPFVGPSGALLMRLFAGVGLQREQLYITNVCKYRPPNNDIKRLPEIGVYFEDEASETMEELAALQSVNVIVAAGDTALDTLTGLHGISKWRGSVLYCHRLHKKVIPILHPAFLLRGMWEMWPVTRSDLARVVEESKTSGPPAKQPRCFLINPDFTTIITELERMQSSEYLSFDIEVRHKKIISCVGVSDSPQFAMCIPLLDGRNFKWTLEEEVEIWYKLALLLQNPGIKKVAQNHAFDIGFLSPLVGGYPQGMWMDTMLAAHILYPELPHDLAFLTSIYTKEPYYKDDIKAWDTYVDQEDLWQYNCKDAACTLEVALALKKDLADEGVTDLFHTFVMPLAKVLFAIQQRGLLVDDDVRQELLFEERWKAACLLSLIWEQAGECINPLSPKQLQTFLYEKLSLPPRYHRKTGKLTTDEEALTELNRKYRVPVLQSILEFRGTQKMLGTYYQAPLDERGRLVTEFVISGTATGRLASRARFDGIGTNLLNFPKEARRMVIPDPGKTFIEADLSQAEARVVAWLAHAEGQKCIFKTGGDIHKHVASAIYKIPQEQISTEQRETAKHVVHAANYRVGSITFARIADISVALAKANLAQYHKAFPEIQAWHGAVEHKLRFGRKLVTALGRPRMFTGPINDDLLRKAVAFEPQSIVADVLNQGLLALDSVLPQGAEILLQVYDSILLQCRPDQVDLVKALLIKALERHILVGGDMLCIPLKVEVKERWH